MNIQGEEVIEITTNGRLIRKFKKKLILTNSLLCRTLRIELVLHGPSFHCFDLPVEKEYLLKSY